MQVAPNILPSAHWDRLLVAAKEHSTIAQRLGDVASETSVAFALTVCEGKSKGASVAIDGGEVLRVLVGTSPACHLRIEDRLVSRP